MCVVVVLVYFGFFVGVGMSCVGKSGCGMWGGVCWCMLIVVLLLVVVGVVGWFWYDLDCFSCMLL